MQFEDRAKAIKQAIVQQNIMNSQWTIFFRRDKYLLIYFSLPFSIQFCIHDCSSFTLVHRNNMKQM